MRIHNKLMHYISTEATATFFFTLPQDTHFIMRYYYYKQFCKFDRSISIVIL